MQTTILVSIDLIYGYAKERKGEKAKEMRETLIYAYLTVSILKNLNVKC